MTRRCRDEDDPVAGYKRANAVDDPDAQQSPARYRFPPQFLKSRLRHVRIMVEVKFNQTVIPAHQSSETRHRSAAACFQRRLLPPGIRSEEHTSELQSLMRISYAVFCLK